MIKTIIKKIPGFSYINKIRKDFDFNKDKLFYLKNYMYSKPINKSKLEYDMLLEIHKLEKGFAVQNPRVFGIDKVKRIIKDINEYEKRLYDKKSFSYNLAYSSLEQYMNFFEENLWKDTDEYHIVSEFMKDKKDYNFVEVGAFDLKKEDIIKKAKIDYDSFISSRRSIRNFSSTPLSEEDIVAAINMTIKTPTACNRQMCKIYYIKTNSSKRVIEKYAQGLGLFDLTNANYFVITFDINANYFIGERNQGWFNSGLVTMNFVNALHSLGIGSCCIQFGNTFKEEREFKKMLNIPNSERIGVIVTAGYYDDISRIPYSTRKPINEIYFER